MENKNSHYLNWRIHTPNLLNEIGNNNNLGILGKPLTILGHILFEVGERCAEINDPILNELMMRLTIYSEADPKSENYNPKLVKKYLHKKLKK